MSCMPLLSIAINVLNDQDLQDPCISCQLSFRDQRLCTSLVFMMKLTSVLLTLISLFMSLFMSFHVYKLVI